jgi:hypothetical protein
MPRGNIVRRVFDPREGRLFREVRTALANKKAVPLRRQVAAWRHGFYAEADVLIMQLHGRPLRLDDRVRKVLASGRGRAARSGLVGPVGGGAG